MPRKPVAGPFLLLFAAVAAPTQAQQAAAPLQQRNGTLQVAEPDAADRELRMTPVVRAVQRAADSVVSVYLQSVQVPGRPPVTAGQGSGVILDDSGLVITNWHVVAPALLGRFPGPVEVGVKLRDGRSRKAEILSSSPTRDLALLQLRLEGDEKVKPIEIGRSGDLMIGETLVAIGNPQGHANTVTSGVLSATGREIQVRAPDNELRTYRDLLQTDAAINQGNSGGALLDITGKLVGINSAMARDAENIGFAIPMDIVREVFEKELVQSSSFALASGSAWVGIEVAERDGQVVVAKVLPGSPAEKAGVAEGDQLVRVVEQPVRSGLDYQRHLVGARAQQPFPLLVRRGQAELRLAPVPITMTNAVILTLVGAELEEVSAAADEELVRKATLAFYRGYSMRRVMMLPSTVRVVSVQPGSPADAVGLQPGDLVLAAFQSDGFREREQPVLSLREFARVLAMQAGRGLKVTVLRGDKDLVGTIDVRAMRKG